MVNDEYIMGLIVDPAWEPGVIEYGLVACAVSTKVCKGHSRVRTTLELRMGHGIGGNLPINHGAKIE